MTLQPRTPCVTPCILCTPRRGSLRLCRRASQGLLQGEEGAGVDMPVHRFTNVAFSTSDLDATTRSDDLPTRGSMWSPLGETEPLPPGGGGAGDAESENNQPPEREGAADAAGADGGEEESAEEPPPSLVAEEEGRPSAAAAASRPAALMIPEESGPSGVEAAPAADADADVALSSTAAALMGTGGLGSTIGPSVLSPLQLVDGADYAVDEAGLDDEAR